MRIGIDYITAFGGGGNATYTRNLLAHLLDLDKSNFYYLYNVIGRSALAAGRENKKKTFENRRYVKNRYVYFPNLISPIFTKKLSHFCFLLSQKLDHLDFFHLTNPINYYQGMDQYIVTIHDLAYLHNEKFIKNASGEFCKKYFKEIIENAWAIIAVSEFTKQDILENFNVSKKKIGVIYEAAADFYRPVKGILILEKFGINKKYILSVAELQPRKNVLALVKAYGQLPKHLQQEYDLVLVGMSSNPKYLEEIKSQIIKFSIESKVKFLGYVDLKYLPALYSGAHLFVYLSFLEGFGLPVLEALSCGTPVLCSSTSSLPEVAGEAGILVDPRDLEETTAKLKLFLENNIVRDKIIEKIPSETKKFSWEKTASQTLRFYRNFYESITG